MGSKFADKFLEALDNGLEMDFVSFDGCRSEHAWKQLLKAYMVAVQRQGKAVEEAVEDEVREIVEDLSLEGRMG